MGLEAGQAEPGIFEDIDNIRWMWTEAVLQPNA